MDQIQHGVQHMASSSAESEQGVWGLFQLLVQTDTCGLGVAGVLILRRLEDEVVRNYVYSRVFLCKESIFVDPLTGIVKMASGSELVFLVSGTN